MLAFRYSPLTIVFAIATIISGSLVLYVWRKRAVPGSIYFTLLMAAVTEWALMYTIGSSIVEAPAVIFCAKLAYVGVVSVPPLWLLFTLAYIRRQPWLTSRWIALLSVIPLVTIGLVMTNEWHGLVWSAITPVSGVPSLIFEHGPWFWVNVLYLYLLLLTCAMILIKAYRDSCAVYRNQIAILLLGIVFPWAGHVLYVTKLNFITGLDLTLIAFICTGILYAWGFSRYQLFDLVPIAREMVITEMAEGVLVLDVLNRIVDLNPAARKLLCTTDVAVGRDVEIVLARWPDLVERCRERKESVTEIRLNDLDDSRWIDVRTSPLNGGKRQPPGLLIILHDVTERKRNEEALRQSNESLHAEMKERALAQEITRTSLHEKEVLLKEIHHRVKNNLQIISSLLNLQSGTSHDNSSAFKESQSRIKSMALIHEKLYQSESLSHIDFSGYVASLTSYLVRSYSLSPNVTMEMDIQGISLDVDKAIPCGLIINELVSNSLKYAFPEQRKGLIRINMIKNEGSYLLIISDNGTGLPIGMDFRNTTSLGLQLVNTLTDQIEGNIELVPGIGTAYRISFKDTEKFRM